MHREIKTFLKSGRPRVKNYNVEVRNALLHPNPNPSGCGCDGVVLLRPHKKWGKLLCGWCGSAFWPRGSCVVQVGLLVGFRWTSGGQSILVWEWWSLRHRVMLLATLAFKRAWSYNIHVTDVFDVVWVSYPAHHAHIIIWYLNSEVRLTKNSNSYIKNACTFAISFKGRVLSMIIRVLVFRPARNDAHCLSIDSSHRV